MDDGYGHGSASVRSRNQCCYTISKSLVYTKTNISILRPECRFSFPGRRLQALMAVSLAILRNVEASALQIVSAVLTAGNRKDGSNFPQILMIYRIRKPMRAQSFRATVDVDARS